MFTHDQIWTAIDRLAKDRGYSASGLARQAGLDPTSFNRSKRVSPSGKPRWPSTESIAKILSVTACAVGDFLSMGGIETAGKAATAVPLLDLATLAGGRNPAAAREKSNKDKDKTAPATIAAAAAHYGPACFATHIDDKRFEPLFRKGAYLLIDPDGDIGPGDRILAFSRRDGLVCGVVKVAQKAGWDLTLPDGTHKAMATTDTAWMGRIVLATQ